MIDLSIPYAFVKVSFREVNSGSISFFSLKERLKKDPESRRLSVVFVMGSIKRLVREFSRYLYIHFTNSWWQSLVVYSRERVT